MVGLSEGKGGVKPAAGRNREEKMWAWAWAKTSWDICSKERRWLVDQSFYGLSWRVLALNSWRRTRHVRHLSEVVHSEGFVALVRMMGSCSAAPHGCGGLIARDPANFCGGR